MNFEEFKKRYEAKLVALGADRNLLPPTDRMAEIFTGLIVLTEWQQEENLKQLRKHSADVKKGIIDNGFYQ
jgi:hypothetical protein